MRRRLHPACNLLLAAAALALLTACAGNNDKNNTRVTATVAATTVTARTQTPAPRTATPTAAPRTPTPAAPLRTPTAVVLRAATPAAAGTATPVGRPASDQALETALANAALKPADLPGSFSPAGPATTTTVLPNQTAGYSITFTDVSRPPQVQAVLVGLAGFGDAKDAADQFKNIEQQITSTPGADFALQPVDNGPKLGDDAKSFRVTGTSQGIPLGGFAVIWRRGKIASIIVHLGAPELKSIDETTMLAQKQDDKLKTVGQ